MDRRTFTIPNAELSLGLTTTALTNACGPLCTCVVQLAVSTPAALEQARGDRSGTDGKAAAALWKQILNRTANKKVRALGF